MRKLISTAVAVFLATASAHAQTAIDPAIQEQVNKIRPEIIKGGVSVITVPCPAGYQSEKAYIQLGCVIVLRILIEELANKGEFGRTICPAFRGDSYQPLFDAITDYVSEKEPSYKERAVTVARIALARRFPCTGDGSAPHEWRPSRSPAN
jgi:hypothetical protein